MRQIAKFTPVLLAFARGRKLLFRRAIAKRAPHFAASFSLLLVPLVVWNIVMTLLHQPSLMRNYIHAHK
jgi:hypothetical protein